MSNKEKLIELYSETQTLGYNLELESYAKYPLSALYPGKKVEELEEEQIIDLITAVVTNLTGQVC
ncbi:hypothetical protein GI075_11315 [Salmonella enterica]|uniref:Uncharacterized protein n=2 Tax=Salmonella enterica TaxID=28901 RepID=A0A737B507_SALNE|nr:hypothetical protein [Salmonella enterica]EDK2264263.1 hypothetical protein [Salmonella enterica subsp. enterica serovar Muenchen]EGY1029745.1 hypothetical protein [Salmonella enterica subsp. enterica serovar Hartford]EAQ4627326.1 hypothetical protein [Salmonella enterica]EAQ5932006.1 hypothetical protein [Salmonella enterica]EAR8245142.1 hypothetical protein [Salmonella enterica]